jgi:methylglutaconyl-CoA hydratase
MSEYQRIVYSVADSVAAITLNRPEKRNALDTQTINELQSALEQAGQEASVKIITVAGAGKDFCSGLDLALLQKISEASILENQEDAVRLANLFLTMRRVPKPIVALVQGRALAGGCGLATASDLLLASESARFGYAEVKLGFIPAIVTVILRRSVGEKKSAELILSGRVVDAAEAERLGLVNRVFADDVFEEKAREVVAELAKNSGQAMMLTKQLLYQIDGLAFESALRSAVNLNTISRQTEDFKHGLAGFLKK